MNCAARQRPPSVADKGEGHDERTEVSPGLERRACARVIAHYENETEDEQFAEVEAAREADGITIMAVPTELVPEVRALIARKENG